MTRLLVLLFAAALCAWGQKAELSGFVRDPSGATVPGASVTLRNVNTSTRISTKSNDAGLYAFPVVDPGPYELAALAKGFDQTVIGGLQLNVGARITRNIDLRVGAVAQELNVDGSGVTVNTIDASVSTLIDSQFVANIPLSGRSFQSLMTIVPGVAVVPSQGTGTSGEMSVNGQRTESNYFTVDGVSANAGVTNTGTPGFSTGYAGSTPSETALGTTQNMIPLDALQEFRATTSTYSAEYGRTPGGQFTFTTRSGGNDWHGSLFEYLRNDAMNANNWFGNATRTPKPAERQNDFGGVFSGPLVRNRTFFFVSHEALRLRSPQSGVTSHVPSDSLRESTTGTLQAVLRAFPVANGAEAGNGLATFVAGYSNPASLDSTSVRIDHSITDNMKLFGRFGIAPSSTTMRMLTNLAQTVHQEADSVPLTLGLTNIIGPRLSNEFRFNSTWSHSGMSYDSTSYGGATPFSMDVLPGVGTDPFNRLNVSLNWGLRPALSFLPQDIHQTQINFVDNLSAIAGRHRLKFGVDFRRLFSEAHVPPLFNPVTYTNFNEVLTNVPGVNALARFSVGLMKPVYTNFSAYAQDDWQLTSRLNLSLGLRWDVNPPPTDGDGNEPYTVDQIENLATTTLAPFGTRLWKTTYNNFAPRLGLAWQANQTPGRETVLRLGAGLFYDLGNNLASSGYGRVGYRTTQRFVRTPFPFTQAQVDSVPAPSTNPPYTEVVLTGDPNLKLPYVMQWSATVEQSLGRDQTLSLSYVGSRGRRLTTMRVFSPNLQGNARFVNNGLYLTTNHGFMQYDGLQAQFQRRLARGLQAQVSYSWSHTIDNATSNFQLFQLLRASSDYDIRHNLQAAVTYDIPGRYANRLASALLTHWALDSRITLRSALPVDVTSSTGVDPGIYVQVNFHPNAVPGQPLYVSDPNAPGGRRINFAAFEAPPAGVEGNVGRNAARAFALSQTDLAVRREFLLTERFRLQFRAEAFNLWNQANFGAIYSQLINGAALFGTASNTLNSQLGGLNSLYQAGGPRSMQLALRLHF